MAPKTYPQQVAELKQDKEVLQGQVEDLKRQVESFAEVRERVSELELQLAEATRLAGQGYGTKAEWNDLKQRAEGNEAAVAHYKKEHAQALQAIEQLESQLDLFGKQSYRLKDLENEKAFLAGELQTANLRTAQGNQQATDQITQLQQALDSQSAELRNLRMMNQSLTKFTNEIRSYLATVPDHMTTLKNLAGIE
jgi:chromosome segregation ATPase